MVGRFNVRGGPGEKTFLVFDNAMNGTRGSGLTEAEAHRIAADLELQFDTYNNVRPAEHVLRKDPPVPVEMVQNWAAAGFLEAWLYEPKSGQWIGRVRRGDRIEWIPQTELRKADHF